MYRLNALDFHLSMAGMCVSVILKYATVVAVPKLCDLYLLGSNPAHRYLRIDSYMTQVLCYQKQTVGFGIDHEPSGIAKDLILVVRE